MASRKRKRGCIGCLFPIVFVTLLFFTRSWWLPAFGHALIKSDPPVSADAIVVLAGDASLSRLFRAEQLGKEGFAPVILVSGPQGMFGQNECELSIPAAKRAGHDTARMVCLGNPGRNTVDECKALLPEIEARKIKRLLVVTSNYHTRRAGKIWRSLAPQLDVRMVEAGDPDFAPDTWFRNREAQKIVLLEWTKSLAQLLGI